MSTSAIALNVNLFSYVWQHSKREQYTVLVLTFVIFPLLYMSLEIPKQIINDVLSGDTGMRVVLGMPLSPVQYLLLLSFSLLALVIVSGLLKMRLNTLKGVLGERVVRRLRYQLIERMLRFRLNRFQRFSQGEVIATVVSETEPLGGFASESIALPVFQGGTLITIMVFMFAQSWQLGLASLCLVPIQLLLIPRLQRRINVLRKKRIERARALAQRLGETVDLIEEIRAQGTRRYTLAEYSFRLGELFRVRLELYERKYFMKFLNNTINQLTPFMFYAVGGILVLKGELSIGALVAAVAAHRDFIDPWRTLLNFYQTWQDSMIKYRHIVDQYSVAEEAATDTVVLEDEEFSQRLLRLENVSCRTEGGTYALRGVNWTLPVGQTVAVVGEATVTRRFFGRVIAGLEKPDVGSVLLGDTPIEKIDEENLAQNIGYVSGYPKIFNAAMSYNLTYGLNHLPPAIETLEQFSQRIESRAVANSEDWFDETFESNWLYLSRLGFDDWDEFRTWMIRCLRVVEADKIIDERAFDEIFNPKALPEEQMHSLGERLLIVRNNMATWLAEDSSAQSWLARFDENLLNPHATLGENFLFGTVVNEAFSFTDPEVREALLDALEAAGLREKAFQLAFEALKTLLRLRQELPANHPVALQFDLHSPDRLQRYKQIAAQIENSSVEALHQDCQAELMVICMGIVPNDWPHLELDSSFHDGLLHVRRHFNRWVATNFRGSFHRFDSRKYNPGVSVLDNILFGRLDPDCECRPSLLHQAQVFAEAAGVMQDLRAQFLISTHAGLGGSRIPDVAHHRINLCRTLLKKPRVLVMHDALSKSGPEQQESIRQNIRELLPDITLLWVTDSIDQTGKFDQVFDLKDDGLSARDESLGRSVETALGASADDTRVSASLLQSIPVLSALNPQQLELVAMHCQRRKGAPGQTIYSPQDRPTHAVVLLSGTALLEQKSPPMADQNVSAVGQGELVGELEIIAGESRCTELQAVSDIDYLLIEGWILCELLDDSPTLAKGMLRSVSKRLLNHNAG